MSQRALWPLGSNGSESRLSSGSRVYEKKSEWRFLWHCTLASFCTPPVSYPQLHSKTQSLLQPHKHNLPPPARSPQRKTSMHLAKS